MGMTQFFLLVCSLLLVDGGQYRDPPMYSPQDHKERASRELLSEIMEV